VVQIVLALAAMVLVVPLSSGFSGSMPKDAGDQPG
jgi:hypothetical protein